MSALLLAIRRIIAILTAFFIPTATAAPAVLPQHSRVVSVSIFQNLESKQNGDIEIVEGEEVPPTEETPETIENEDNAAAQENGAAPQMDIIDEEEAGTLTEAPTTADDLTYARTAEVPAVQTWDVSATNSDNVTMSFYDTEDTESLLDQLAGRITALFTPMTAYAASLDFTAGTTAEFKADDEAQGGDIQFGKGAQDVNNPVTGTLVISGRGYMMEELYNCLIDPDLYVNEIVRLFKTEEGLDVTPIINGEYEDLRELDSNIKWEVTDAATGEKSYVDITGKMNEALNPQAVLKYSPKEVIIGDGVKNVSDFAFMMCKDLTAVHIASNIKEIGMGAFAYCTNLETVTFDEGVRTIGESAFAYCSKLSNIVLPSSVTFIDYYAFESIKEGTTITCPNDMVRAMFAERLIALDDVVIK